MAYIWFTSGGVLGRFLLWFALHRLPNDPENQGGGVVSSRWGNRLCGVARFFALFSNKINCKILHIIIIWYICSVNLMNYGRDKGCLGALDLGEEGLLFR